MKTIRFSLRSVLGITFMATAIITVSVTNAHAQTVWDLATDFSLTGSPTAEESDGIGPDGAWSFHVDGGGSEVLFDATGESKFAGGDTVEPNNLWTASITGADQNNLWVAKAEVAGTAGPMTGFDLLAGEINIAPSTTTNPDSNVILRWTAPSNMTVAVDGIVWGAHTGQTRPTSFDITHTDSSGTPMDGGVGNIVANTPYVGNDSRVLAHPFGGFSDPTNHPTILASNSSAIELSVSAGDRIDLKNYVSGNDGTISGIEFIVTQTSGSAPIITSFEWVADTLGDWSEPSNWTPGRGPPNTANHTAVFGNMTTGPTTAVMTKAVTVNRIEFANSNHTYAIGGLGSVNLAPTTAQTPVNPSIDVQGTHLFQAVVNLEAPTIANVSDDSTLTFDGALNLAGTTLTKTGAGTLVVNNRVTLGGGTIISTQGTISGFGTIGGDVNNQGGTISPGNSSGIQSVPEPSSLMLSLTCLLALASLCHRAGRVKTD